MNSRQGGAVLLSLTLHNLDKEGQNRSSYSPGSQFFLMHIITFFSWLARPPTEWMVTPRNIHGKSMTMQTEGFCDCCEEIRPPQIFRLESELQQSARGADQRRQSNSVTTGFGCKNRY
jgi:hypothetical protein